MRGWSVKVGELGWRWGWSGRGWGMGGEEWEVAGAGGDVARGVVERDEDGGM